MPWYVVVALVCAVIAPFDALYLHIKADRRREALRREREQAAKRDRACGGVKREQKTNAGARQ